MSPALLSRSTRSIQQLSSRSSLTHRNPTPAPGPWSLPVWQKANLSTGEGVKSQKAPPSNLNPKSSPSENPSYPAFSFEGLGANRTVKYVVIGALSVLGTIESIFWAKTLQAKFWPSTEEEDKPERI